MHHESFFAEATLIEIGVYKYFAPFSRFSHTLLYTNFHIFNSKRNIFLIPVTPMIGEIFEFNCRLQQLKASLEQYFTF